MDEPIDISSLQTRLKAERTRRGLSLRAAADEAEVPFNTLARAEKGQLPDLANFRRIVTWLGLPPELFFQPPKIRTETTPEVIANHLIRDPNLTEAAATQIADLVRTMYASLAQPAAPTVQVHLRAAPTFKPEAARLLGDLLESMQARLLTQDSGAGE